MTKPKLHPGAQRRIQLRMLLLGGGAVLSLAFLFSTLTRAPEPIALLGKPAPAVPLDLIGGGTLDLKQHAGDVVVLDFWATWCPPCRVSMPIVDRVAEEYAARGVHLYFVNEGEPRDLVESFAEDAKLRAPIALDTDRVLGWAFRAEGLPFMAIIGRNGAVRSVRVGVSMEIETEFRADLDAALAETLSQTEPEISTLPGSIPPPKGNTP